MDAHRHFLKEAESRKKSFVIPLLVILAAGILLAVYFFSGLPYRVCTENLRMDQSLYFSAPTEEIGQTFTIPDQAEGLSAVMIAYGREQEKTPARGKLTVRLYEDGSPVGEWTDDTRFLTGDRCRTYRLEKPVPVHAGSTWQITVTDDFTGGEGVAVWTTREEGREPLTVDGELLAGRSLCFRAVYTMTSALQRGILAFLIFLSVCILVILCSRIPDIRRNGYDEKNTGILWVCAVILLCLFAFLYQHDDGLRITHWGIHFLEALQNGQLRNYGAYLEEVCEISNYNIVVHMLTAVCLLPLYLADRLFRLQISMPLYDYWRKLFLILFLAASAKLIGKIGKELGFSEETGNVLGILYLISPSALWGNLGLGQTDCISVCFLLLFMYDMVKKRPLRASFWLSVSVVIKSFPLFFIAAPLLAAALGARKYREILACGAVFQFLPVTSAVLSRTFFRDYAAYAAFSERDWDHFARLFDASVAETSCFLLALLLVCACCFYRARHSSVSEADFILASSAIVFSFLAFVYPNPQWILYPSLFLLLGAFFTCDREDILYILPFFQAGAFLYCMFWFRGNSDTVLLRLGIIGRLFPVWNNDFSFYEYAKYLLPGYYGHLTSVWKTLLSGSVITAFALFLRSRKQADRIGRDSFGSRTVPAVVIPLLFAIDLAVVICSFVMSFALVLC